MLKEIEEQIKEFDKLIRKYPHIDELYIGRAILHTKMGEYEKAIKDYEKAHKDYIYDLVIVCKRNNLIKEVEEFYTKKINKDKNNTVNYMSRARLYMSVGENKKALEDCESILKIYPNNKLVLGFKKRLIKELKKENHAKNMKSPKILLT